MMRSLLLHPAVLFTIYYENRTRSTVKKEKRKNIQWIYIRIHYTGL